MSYFDDDHYSESERRNAAFTTTKAVRESVSLARRAQNPITYESALDLIYDLDPEIYKAVTDLLKSKNESDFVKYYKEKAEALTTGNIIVSPIDLIDDEIAESESLVEMGSKKKFLKKRLFDLKAAREYFNPREVSEHKILNHDFYLAERPDLFSNIKYQSDSYKDYSLDDDRVLRMRLLHPDKPEAILGTDLIYEQFDLLNDRVRFVHLQYKMWDDDQIYFSQGSVGEQINKLQSNLCNSGFCCDVAGNKHNGGFRFPHCSAFFRPTNKLLSSDSKLVSNGLHIPICNVKNIQASDKKVSKKNARGKGVTYKIFEELFLNDFIGSRWMTLNELDEFYSSRDICSMTNSIRVHAQEIIIASEEEIDLKNGIE
jgi:hypothetical protein